MKTFFPIVSFLFISSRIVSAHSHVECTKVSDAGDKCLGYARFYWYNKQGYEGTDESRDRNNIVSAGLQNCPIRPAAGEPYNNDYPMASVRPGETVKIQWPPVSLLNHDHSLFDSFTYFIARTRQTATFRCLDSLLHRTGRSESIGCE